MLKIEWMMGYGNLPHFILEETLALTPREESEYEFIDGLWYHIQKNGIVRYFAHSGFDRNEGGYGGAAFTFLHNGEKKRLVGPWSSRASALNMRLPADKQVVDIRLDNGSQYPTNCGILVSELVERWDSDEAYLLRALNRYDGEHGAITASLAPDRILKPNGYMTDDNYEYEIFAKPKGN